MINEEEEKFLYNLMNQLYQMNIPIVFKGALVLKAIQYNCGNPTGIIRETHDIDGDWVNGVPSMEMLTGILQEAVNRIEYPLIVVPYREYGNGKSAGFNFNHPVTGQTFTSMDLSIRENNNTFRYSYINGIQFYGQSIDKIVADKVLVCSSRKVFRRIKDVIDLYILSYCWSGSNIQILQLIQASGKSIEMFNEFMNNYTELLHAYSKYSNTATENISFEIIYSRVKIFLEPYIRIVTTNHIWNGNNWV